MDDGGRKELHRVVLEDDAVSTGTTGVVLASVEISIGIVLVLTGTGSDSTGVVVAISGEMAGLVLGTTELTGRLANNSWSSASVIQVFPMHN